MCLLEACAQRFVWAKQQQKKVHGVALKYLVWRHSCWLITSQPELVKKSHMDLSSLFTEQSFSTGQIGDFGEEKQICLQTLYPDGTFVLLYSHIPERTNTSFS